MEILIEPTIATVSDQSEEFLIDQSMPKVENRQALAIDILKECARINYSNGFSKLVSFDDLVNTLANAIGSDKISSEMTSLSLPPNVFLCEVNESYLNIACFHEGGIRGVNFNDNIQDRITPNVIIYFKLSRGSTSKSEWIHESTRYFCTDVGLSEVPREFVNSVNKDKRIFLLPFPNMYASGEMCTGQNQLPKKFLNGDLRSLKWHFDMVWSSPFNYDLGIRSLKDDSVYLDGHRGIDKWFVHLAKIAEDPSPKFPFAELRGWREIKTS
jgi:Prokaryotic E2 family D